MRPLRRLLARLHSPPRASGRVHRPAEVRANARSELRASATAPLRLAAFAALATLAACRAQRTLEITSEPSECEVRLDGERIGVTPVSLPFEHYGTRRVSLYRSGYRTYSRLVQLSPPWYARFPIDLVSEVLVPLGWRDVHSVHVRMQPGVPVLLEPDLQDILDRAEGLRRAGPEGPPPPAPRPSDAAQPPSRP